MLETSPAKRNIGRNDNVTEINDVLLQLGRIENELGRMQVVLVECMRKEELHLRLLACGYFDWVESFIERSMPETSPVRRNIGRNDNVTAINDVLLQLGRIENEFGRMQVVLVECMRKEELHLRLLVETWFLLSLVCCCSSYENVMAGSR